MGDALHNQTSLAVPPLPTRYSLFVSVTRAFCCPRLKTWWMSTFEDGTLRPTYARHSQVSGLLACGVVSFLPTVFETYVSIS